MDIILEIWDGLFVGIKIFTLGYVIMASYEFLFKIGIKTKAMYYGILIPVFLGLCYFGYAVFSGLHLSEIGILQKIISTVSGLAGGIGVIILFFKLASEHKFS